MNKHYVVVALLSFFCLFCGDVWAINPELVLATPSPKKVVDAKSKNLANSYLLKSTSAWNIGNTDSAYFYIKKSLKLDNNNDLAYYQWYRIEMSYERFNPAQFAIAAAYYLDSLNVSYVTECAQLALELQNYNKSEKCFNQLIVLKPDSKQAYRGLLNCALYKQDIVKATQMLKKIKELGDYDDAIFACDYTLLLGKSASSADSLADNYFKETGSFMAPLMRSKAEMGRKDYKMMKYWQDIAESINPTDPGVILNFANYAYSVSNDSLLFLALKRILSSDQIAPDNKINAYDDMMNNEQFLEIHKDEIDSIFAHEKNLNHLYIFQYFRSKWELSKGGANAANYLMGCINDFESDSKSYDYVKQNWKSVRDESSLEPLVRLYTLRTQYWLQQKNWNEAFLSANAAVALFPTDGKSNYVQGMIYLRLKNKKEAIKSFERAIQFSKNDTIILKTCYLSIADYYFQVENNSSKAIGYYEKAILYSLHDPVLLNNYAYCLATLGQDLSKALYYSNLSIELSPDNPVNLDTYAWILFKMKKYDQALEKYKLIMALLKKPDPEILEHYGDVLSKLGQSDLAKMYWQQAIDNGAKFKLSEK